MASFISKEHLLQLERFISTCKTCPSILHEPQLKFFKDYLLSLGAVIPEATEMPPDDASKKPFEENTSEGMDDEEENEDAEMKDEEEEESSEEEEGEEDEESEIELDNTGVIEADSVEPAPEGDDSLEVTDEMIEESNEKRSLATQALNDGNFEDAVKFFTEAILKNPQSAALYAKRAGAFLKQQRPNAAIRDCNKALSLNPDQPLAYKHRGRAHRLLGNWEEASQDLALACKLDYSDEANEWLKEVMPNTKKLQEHRRKFERKKLERELRERQKRYEKVKEQHEKASKQTTAPPPGFEGFPGAFGKDSPFDAAGMQELLKDPEILQAFQDPEVAKAFQDIAKNPANIIKYQSNPKVLNVMQKLSTKFGPTGTPEC